MRPTWAADRSDDGLTLIDVLLGTVLSAVLIAALVGGLITYMRGATNTANALAESPQLQLAATVFAGDIQSSTSVDTALTAATCGTGISTAIANVAWIDPGPQPALTDDLVVNVTYYTSTASGTGQITLLRNYCKGTAAVVTRKIVSTIKPTMAPVVSCVGGSCASPAKYQLPLQVCTVDSLTNTCRGDVLSTTLVAERRVP